MINDDNYSLLGFKQTSIRFYLYFTKISINNSTNTLFYIENGKHFSSQNTFQLSESNKFHKMFMEINSFLKFRKRLIGKKAKRSRRKSIGKKYSKKFLLTKYKIC